MRRPSRLGLLPVCPRWTSLLLTAQLLLQRKEKSFFCAASPISGSHLCTDRNPGAKFRSHPLLVFVPLLFAALLSRGQDLQQDLGKYFQDIRNEVDATPPGAIIHSANEIATLDLLQSFVNDSIHVVKRKALVLISAVAQKSEDSSVRNRGVNMILNGTGDRALTGVSLDLLKSFRQQDFSDSSKNIVRNRVRAEGSYLKEWIKLAGFLELKDLTSIIRPLSQPGNAQGLRWAAIISLARMGDPPALSDMIRRVRRLPVNDDLVYRVFPDLIFTRQQEAISIMVEAMHDDSKNCLSADAENAIAIPCGYRIMEQLAPVIDDFPLAAEAGGDLQTSDYRQALEIVRSWFRANADYKIIKHTY